MDFAACAFYNMTTDEWMISLRGVDKVDLSKIAERFKDGGGHKNAAGFTLTGLDSLNRVFMPI